MNSCISAGYGEQGLGNARRLVRILKVMGYLQVFVSLYSFVINLVSGVVSGIACIVLCFALINRNWGICVVYLLFCVVDGGWAGLMFVRVVVGWVWEGGGFGLLFIIFLIKVPFCLVSGFYCFLLYRELKAQVIEELLSVVVVTNYGANEGRGESGRDFESFTGASYRI